MGFFNKEVELIIPSSLNGYDAIREKLDEGNTMTVKTPVEQPEKPKTKVSIGL